MDIGLLIGLVFIALCVIVQMSSVFDDDTLDQKHVKPIVKKKPTKSFDDIAQGLISISRDIDRLSIKADIDIKLPDSFAENINKSNNFNSTFIETNIKQMLESVEIVHTTKNVDVFLSRYEFMKGLAPKLMKECNESTYIYTVGKAVELYRNLYYDRILTDIQLRFVTDPNVIYSDDVFGELLYSCYVRFCDKMEIEINNLKTQKAKDRRIDKIIEVSQFMTPYITNDTLVTYANKVLSMITTRFGIKYNVSVKTEI